ncbi:hypothetical protein L7F22_011044 [Adiantum nelumboides]|nr:hypothetical protein [Adiantum nelumboides]
MAESEGLQLSGLFYLLLTILQLLGKACNAQISSLNVGICSGLQQQQPLVPAFFLLGDSILDPGNNNRFITLAKVDHYPYGIDFPGNVPTGRFSNGYTAADYLAFKLGLPLIPAYHNPSTRGKRLLKGVNFASGGSGILPNTGKIYGEVESLEEQVQSLQAVKNEVTGVLGSTAAADELFASAAFMVVTGSNDWLLSFFNPILPIRIADKTSSEHHRDTLIDTLLPQIEAMYEVGARKIVVAGLPALGCCPSQVMQFETNGSCVEHVNGVAKDYNQKLLPQVVALNDRLANATIAYIDVYSLILKAAQNPSEFGFKTGNIACCGIGKYKGFLTCLPGLQPCDIVEDHFYWDAYHPTQNFYPFLVDHIWNEGPPYSYPNSLQKMFDKQGISQILGSSHTEL